ncbi:MAG: alpha-L-arabinofuranosidase C-terminal domain-containing protein [Vicinamibacterales bacterium]
MTARPFRFLAVGTVIAMALVTGTDDHPAMPLGLVLAQTGGNAVVNGSFEELEGRTPRGWRTSSARTAVFETDETGHEGSRSVRISSAQGADAWWFTIVPVRPYARYRLSGWIKTEGLDAGSGQGALFNLHGLSQVRTRAVTGTTDWTEVSLEFDTEANDAVQLNCLFGGWGRARGTAWFDDVRLEMLSARELAPSVTIRAGQRLHPVSKYIYGQFIEHLGRCIYGGIWAEMLEDRKFYYPVGAKESPWAAVGEAGAVVMSKDGPYVGEHSPMVRTGGANGIRHGGLALIRGKSYTGRVVLAGEASAAPVEVSLVWGDGPAERKTVTVHGLGQSFQKVPFTLTAGGSTESGWLEIVGKGRGWFKVGAVSIMPSDNVEGFRPDVLRLLAELDAPVYRWPGGNFVSGYDWRDGVGDPDKRPPRKNPAWRGIEHNDVGIHEFMAFCRLLGAEPYIAVNSGLGDASSAADEVEYVNGAPTTPMGRLRAANGHEKPFGCRWWSIGNEMYGDWQLGHMPLTEYTKKHNAFAAAMRAKDSSIKLIAVGNVGEWDEAMLRESADHMTLLSEHFYSQERPGLLAHVSQIPSQVRRIANAMRRYRETMPQVARNDIRVALDEWNYWYGPHVYGELGTQYFLKDALGIAAGLHEYARQSDVIAMANYAQTVNVIGAIKTSKTESVFDTTGLVLKLYRARFGDVPVVVEGAPEPLDVAAAWRDDRRVLTVAVVNATRESQPLRVAIQGIDPPSNARLWRIAGTDEKACNVPGRPPQVAIEEVPSAPFGPIVTLPPMSISIFEVRT